MHIKGFSSSNTYASGYASRNAGGPGQGPYVRSHELNELPMHGTMTKTVIGAGQTKASQVLGREDEVSDIGSDDFIIHSREDQGITKTNTVTVSHDMA
jgi:hypothetical protein